MRRNTRVGEEGGQPETEPRTRKAATRLCHDSNLVPRTAELRSMLQWCSLELETIPNALSNEDVRMHERSA